MIPKRENLSTRMQRRNLKESTKSGMTRELETKEKETQKRKKSLQDLKQILQNQRLDWHQELKLLCQENQKIKDETMLQNLEMELKGQKHLDVITKSFL